MSGDTLTSTDLQIGGMTCAACSSRVQRGLSRIEGVDAAQVNFATGRATVTHSSTLDVAELARVVDSLGYSVADHVDAEAAADARTDDLWRRFLVAAAFTIPAAVVSMLHPLHFEGWRWLVAALTTPVVFWSGWPFHRAAAVNLRHRATTMDTLVSLGSLSAWVWSAVVLVASIDAHIYFETGAVIVTLIVLGKYFEARARRRSGDAIRALVEIGARDARLVDGTTVPAEMLEIGMEFEVRPGERIATDGVVVQGRAAVDASMITGEPVPVDVGPGDEVIGSTIDTDGVLVVRATRVGADTALAQIIDLVDQAQGSRAEVQRLADRVASVFVPVAIGIAVLTLAAWLVSGAAADDAFTAAVAVLIISCPCALGLATPLGIMVGTGRGAQLGVIIKGGEVLEDTRAVDVVVLDKTGTITTAEMALADVIAPRGDRSRLAAMAAALEERSEHPIARAIAAGGAGELEVTDFRNRAGVGVTGIVDGRPMAVGRATMFDDVPASITEAAAHAVASGATAVFAGRDGVAEAVLVVTDTIKASSARAVDAFHDLGLTVVLLTGDNAVSAEAVGREVGVDEVVAEVLPAGKVDTIRSLQASGRRVAMVGDGINDGPALAQADLGIAIGTGTDVALEASDLTVVSGDLLGVADAIALARRTLATIRGNLFWAFAYNTAAIPLAAFGVLNPMIAAGAMGLSSLFVVSNSLRLRRFDGYRAAAREPQ